MSQQLPALPAPEAVTLRVPDADDGAALYDLIAACPPLDRNSRYCNLLQVTHFAATSVVAEAAGRLLGAVTGYLRPAVPECLFIWQVAVAADARGQGLAPRMLEEIVNRPGCRGVRRMETTVTPDNRASWSAFRKFAAARGAAVQESPLFSRSRHFAGRHDDEVLLRIGRIGTVGPLRSADASR